MTTLTINDLAAVRNIIDLACKRGAFGAAEIKEVSAVYEKVDTVIKSILNQVDTAAVDPNTGAS